MTDAHLMDADCIHGQVWFECPTCEAETNAYFAKLAELCPTCCGDGWIVVGQTHAWPYGEQVQCPDCEGEVNDAS